MKLLKEISEKSLGLGAGPQVGGTYELQIGARALLFNEAGDIAVQHLTAYGFHKLPGGRVRQDEDIKIALKREVQEEVGCECEVNEDIGVVLEYCNTINLVQVSYAYVANKTSEVRSPMLGENEVDEGQKTIWMTPYEAVEQIRKDAPKKFEGHFIRERELAFLNEYITKVEK